MASHIEVVCPNIQIFPPLTKNRAVDTEAYQQVFCTDASQHFGLSFPTELKLIILDGRSVGGGLCMYVYVGLSVNYEWWSDE